MKRAEMGLFLTFLLGCSSECVAGTAEAGATVGCESNPTGNPIGGGAGYTGVIDPSQADYTVSTKVEFLNALAYVQANAQDSAGGNHGVVYGAAWEDGKTGKGLRFDGVDDSVDVAAQASLKLTDAMSVAMWVRFDALTENETPVDNGLYQILHRGGWAGNGIYFLFRISGTDSPGDSAWDGWAGVRTDGELVSGRWYHVVGVKERNWLRIYLNGVLSKELQCMSGQTVDGAAAGDLYLGLNPFQGGLDEVKIYGRALTASEVSQEYAGGSVSSGLVSWWGFEEDPAPTRKTVYVSDDAVVDLSGDEEIGIPTMVTLASGRGRNGSQGALIRNRRRGADAALLLAKGPGVRLTGLRLIGPDLEIGDHHYEGPYRTPRGIQSGFPGLEVDNCELAGWGHAAIALTEGATGAFIHHNYIHHNRRAGLGYGVVHGYCTASNPISSLIEGNLFDYCRHHIAGTGTPGISYEARYNLSLEHDNGHCFDMHGGVDREDGTDIAGDWIKIHHNTFRDREEYAVGIRGIPRFQAQVHNNWFYHDILADAVFQSNGDVLPRFRHMKVVDNLFGTTPPAGTVVPVALPKASPASGQAPLTVSFDASGSDVTGGTITGYTWYFGDGKDAIGATAHGAQTGHTFKNPGRYDVTLQVTDNRGIRSRAIVPVTVTPAEGSGNVLSFWVKDSYRGRLRGYYRKEVLLDGKIVWSDDVEGDEGWVHVVRDVSAQVAGRASVSLTLRVYCTKGVTDPAKQIIDVFVYWDDVFLSGFDVKNGGFETPDYKWRFSYSDPPWETWITTGESRSGFAGFSMCAYYMETTTSGSWAMVEQTVARGQ
ncbi:MAG: PKD domain-containing protein [Acidobacteria bacterium]|nr:PKD domain-containing protein [Acidobacteriota bacterium]